MKKIVVMCFLLLLTSSICNATAIDPNQSISTYAKSNSNNSSKDKDTQEISVSKRTTGESDNSLNNQIHSEKPRIALVINTDSLTQLHEKTPLALRSLLNKKFPEAQYTLIEDKQFYQSLLTSMEDEKISDMSMVNREIVSSLGKKYGYDYVVLLIYNFGTSDFSSSFWTATYKAVIKLNAKVIDVNLKDYLYRQDISVSGKSADAFGRPSYQSAIHQSMVNTTKQFCDEVKIDLIPNPLKKP
ncbi:hypothetical protein [Sporomusa aerivorans]|uniref:hypothetical protein n=1 Tax=Sporomusa aerivorans TaxID=204936 RepID=UPI00352AC8C3